jgi:hypothetical protein
VEVRLAERGSPDWQAGADLVHRRYSDEYDAVPYPHPDNFLIMRAGAGDGPPPVVGCAGFTYHSERSFVSERCAGRSVVELFREHLGVTVDPADVVEVGPAAGTGLGTGYEIGRLVPIVAWTQGMRYVIGVVTRSLQRAYESMELPFRVLSAASNEWMTEAEQATYRAYFTSQQPVVIAIPLDSIGGLVASNTGRYRFTDLRLRLVDRHPADR